MSTQPSAIGSVHTGTWTNWTHGAVLGATWTTSLQNGAYLVAFLALFVRVAGGHFWDIFCYVLFQLRSTARDEDGLFHQQQAVLRNTGSDSRAAWKFLTLGWYWRKMAKRTWKRTLPLVFGAILNILAFGAAGIFVSRVTNNGSQVLLRENACGFWTDVTAFGQTQSFTPEFIQQQQEFSANLQYVMTSASTYAAECYGYDSHAAANVPSPDCNAYGRQLINWSVDTNATCPFAPEMCVDNLAVRLDTGYIDSHLHLGINAPKEDRVLYREVFECAPITSKGFSSGWLDVADSGLSPGEYTSGLYGAQIIRYDYGPNYYLDTNDTFYYSNTTFGTIASVFNQPNYLLDTEATILGNYPMGTFVPIPQLNRTDADVTMLFLMTETTFVSPVNDPWFKAQIPEVYIFQNTDGSFTNVSFYSSESPVSVLACTEQRQWCNPTINGEGRCTELTGTAIGSATQAMEGAGKEIKLNQRQTGVLQRIYHAIWDNHIYNTGDALGGDIFLANMAIANGQGSTLPDNQWILEVNHFLATSLTSVQMAMADYVAGLRNASQNKYLVQPDTGDTEWMCTNQIVQRSDFASFNIFGLVVIFVIGGALVIVNLVLDPTIRYTHARRGNTSAYRDMSWRANNTLNLQSMAFEAGGMGVWDRKSSVPVTKQRESFSLPKVAATIFESDTSPLTAWPSDRYFGKQLKEVDGHEESARNSTWSIPRIRTKTSRTNVDSRRMTDTTSPQDLQDLISPSTAVPDNSDYSLPRGDFMKHGVATYLPPDTSSRQSPPKYQRVGSDASPEITYS